MKKLLVLGSLFFAIMGFAENVTEFQKEVCGEHYVPVGNETLVKDIIPNETIMVFAEQIDIPANTQEIALGEALILVPVSADPRFLASGINDPYSIQQVKAVYPAFLRIRKNVRFSFERAFNDKFNVKNFMEATDNMVVLCTRKNPATPI